MDLSFPSVKKGKKGRGRGREGARKRLDLCKVRRIHFASEESDASSKGTNPADCVWLSSKLYFVPVSSFKHNRRRGFLEATDYEMSRTCMPYLYFILRELCLPVKIASFERIYDTFFGKGRGGGGEGGILISRVCVFGWIIYSN